MKVTGLTQKQESFCLAYIEVGNASEAYRRVYNVEKMKSETINRKAFDLLQDGKITARINELRQRLEERTLITEARVIEEVARLGLVDPSRLMGENGELLPIRDIPPEVRAAIASIEIREEKDEKGRVVGHIKKIKLWDKNSALEKLMKHLGSFEKDNKQRAGLFDHVPRKTMKIIEEKLLALRTGVAGQPAAASTSRATH